MKRNILLFLFLAAAMPLSARPYSSAFDKGVRAIESRVVEPSFPAVDYVVTDFGARGDGSTDALPAIRAAIEKCTLSGGGRVVIPAGRYFSRGPIVLKSNVNLHLDRGAEIIFSCDAADYLPAVLTRWEGTEVFNYSPLIYAYNVKNIAITGQGTLNGQGSKFFSSWKSLQSPDQKRLREQGTAVAPVYERVFGQGHFLRPAFIEPVNCSDVLIEGITVNDSPFWCVHLLCCNSAMVRGLTVDSVNYNNDGCDPESCRDVIIENCYFHTGDDGIAIKSGRDNDAWRIGQPTQDVIVRNCTFNSDHNAMCIGSEISGGIRGIYVYGIKIIAASSGLYFKSNKDRGGYLCDVFVRDVKADKIAYSLIEIQPDYKKPEATGNYPTLFRNFHFYDITAADVKVCAIEIAGFDTLPVQNVELNNIKVQKAARDTSIKCAEGIVMKNVTINGRPCLIL